MIPALKDTPVNKILFNKHPKRKNNDLVAAMHAMYKGGRGVDPKSLEEVGRVYGKTRQAVYDTFQTRGYPLRSKKMEGVIFIKGVRYIPDKYGYLRGTIRGKRVHAHRYLWEKENGKIPSGFVLYFKDGNKNNVSMENLDLLAKENMSKVFNPTGRNQFSL